MSGGTYEEEGVEDEDEDEDEDEVSEVAEDIIPTNRSLREYLSSTSEESASEVNEAALLDMIDIGGNKSSRLFDDSRGVLYLVNESLKLESPMIRRQFSSLWGKLPDLPMPLHGAAAWHHQGLTYIIGGGDGHLVYDGVLMLNRQDEKWTIFNQMNVPRMHHAGAQLGDEFWVTGGFDGSVFLRSVESWKVNRLRADRHSSSWMIRPELPEDRCYHAAVTLDGCIYVLGGESTKGGDDCFFTRSVVRLDPRSGQGWTSCPPMRTARSRFAACVFHGRIFVFGGLAGGGALLSVESWAPEEDEWKEEQPMTTLRFGHSVVCILGRIYVIGGYMRHMQGLVESWMPNTLDLLQDVETRESCQLLSSHLEKERWRAEIDFPDHRKSFSVVLAGPQLYMLGGVRYEDGTETPSCWACDVQRYMILGEMKDHWREQEMPLETDVMKRAIELFGRKLSDKSSSIDKILGTIDQEKRRQEEEDETYLPQVTLPDMLQSLEGRAGDQEDFASFASQVTKGLDHSNQTAWKDAHRSMLQFLLQRQQDFMSAINLTADDVKTEQQQLAAARDRSRSRSRRIQQEQTSTSSEMREASSDEGRKEETFQDPMQKFREDVKKYSNSFYRNLADERGERHAKSSEETIRGQEEAEDEEQEVEDVRKAKENFGEEEEEEEGEEEEGEEEEETVEEESKDISSSAIFRCSSQDGKAADKHWLQTLQAVREQIKEGKRTGRELLATSGEEEEREGKRSLDASDAEGPVKHPRK